MTVVSNNLENVSTGVGLNANGQLLIVTTSGSVIGDNYYGVYGSPYYGSDRVVNSGEIFGGKMGVVFFGNFCSLVNNSGATIIGGNIGLYADNIGAAITNDGTIQGGIYGVQMDGQGNVVYNHGHIIGNSAGVAFDGPIASQLVNSGTVEGPVGVTISAVPNITITNSGTITGTSIGIQSTTLSGFADNNLAITNTGTINGGINIATLTATIHNSGTITGEIDISGAGAALRNTGTITDDVVITGAGAALSNSGAIHGDVSFGSGPNIFTGTGGTIDGTLTGGTGNDNFELGRQSVSGLIDGGSGIDTISFATATGAVTVDLAGGTATGTGVSDSIANFENVTGSIYADTLYGTDGNNLLSGGAGADTMTGGLGDDVYNVDNVGDKVVELANGGNDTVYASVSYNLTGTFVETLTLVGTANINATGNGNNNTLNGNAGNNILDGGAGADTMAGGAGNDTYYVDNVGDKVIEASGAGTDTIYSSVTYSLAGSFVETLALTGSAAINATGNGQNNTLIGNSANNIITTGGGADIVVYASATFGADTITDFTAGNATGHDTIQFASTIFANFAAVTAHAAQVGADTIITYDAHDTIDLQGVTLANLTASDFAFV